MHDVRGPRQQRNVPRNDDALETVIYKNQEAFKQLREGFHRSPPQDVLVGQPKSSVLATGGINRLPSLLCDSFSQGFQGLPLVIFRVSDHDAILRALAQPGVSRRTLFPDLAGLADFLHWRHFHAVRGQTPESRDGEGASALIRPDHGQR
jgi:hypothetical protein